MKIVRDDIRLCSVCMIAAVNGDVSGLDYSHDTSRFASVDEHAEAVWTGLESFGAHLCPNFDPETGEGHYETDSRSCDCCGSPYEGARYVFVVLGEDDAPEQGAA